MILVCKTEGISYIKFRFPNVNAKLEVGKASGLAIFLCEIVLYEGLHSPVKVDIPPVNAVLTGFNSTGFDPRIISLSLQGGGKDLERNRDNNSVYCFHISSYIISIEL